MPSSTSQVMAPILARQFCTLQAPPFPHLPEQGLPAILQERAIITPLVSAAWRQALQHHPDQKFVCSLLAGLEHGFRIGLHEAVSAGHPASNSPSAVEHSTIVDNYIREQLEKGYMMGPFPPNVCSKIVSSSLAVIPKKTPGKWRIIVDLSRPAGRSVNDCLRRQATHVAYSSVDDAALLMHSLGPGSLLAKIDVKEAYRIIPIHPADRRFLGVHWQGNMYVDCQLPFGLASAPAIFSALGEALEWILRRRGVEAIIHYIDDFLLLGRPGSSECEQALSITLETCKELGVPIAAEKTEGPATAITFLGITLDSGNMSTSLPGQKLAELQAMIRALSESRVIRDLHSFESLIGHLVHAATVCPLAKAFMNNLFALKAVMRPGQTRRLNVAARSDLAWWELFLQNWKGTSVQQFLTLRSPDVFLYCDAASSWGCAAWAPPMWLIHHWQEGSAPDSIATQELVSVVLAAGVWGRLWTGKLVLAYSDNSPVVSQVNSLHARDPLACHLLRCLALFQALHDFRLRASFVPGSANVGADLLSRGKIHQFLNLFPASSPSPSQIPAHLTELLSSPPPLEVTLQTWKGLFSSFWTAELPSLPRGYTPQPGTGISHLLSSFPSHSGPFPPRR